MKTKTTKKALALLLALAMALTLFAGCGTNEAGNNEGTNPSDSTNPSGSTNPSEGTNTGSNPESTASEYGLSVLTLEDTQATNTSGVRDVLNIACTSDFGSLDPFTTASSSLDMHNIYQRLGYMRKGEFFPCLMKTYSFNDDQTILYGEIFDNIYDSNGVHMTADDIVWCFSQHFASSDPVGVSDYIATGDYTFELHLKNSLQVGALERIMKFNMVCRESFESSPDGMVTTPVGTGPYVLTGLTSGYLATMEARDDYWQTDDSQRCYADYANVKTINFYMISESEQISIALENKTIDSANKLVSDQLERLKTNDDYKLYASYSSQSLDFIPNCDSSSPMSDLNLRLACAYAIDAQALVNGVYGEDSAAINHSICPDWSVDYDPSWSDADSYYNVYDPELAKDYLAKSNYNGETLTLMCTSQAVGSSCTQMILVMLKAIGIECEMKALESSVFRQYMKDSNEWDICIYNAGCNDYWIDGVHGNLSTDATSWGGSQNFIYDDKLQEMIATQYSYATKTAEGLAELNQYINDNCYWYSLVNTISYTALPSDCYAVAPYNQPVVMTAQCLYTGD